MCFDELNGIEVGEMIGDTFVKADRHAQVTFDCFLNQPQTIGAYQIIGTFVGKNLIEDVYKLSPNKNDILFRICFEKNCIYSNTLERSSDK
jgi:hypothetical protein